MTNRSPEMKVLTVALENCKKSPRKHSIEKPSLPNFQNLYNIVVQFGPRLQLMQSKIKIYDPEIICCIVKSTRPQRNWLRSCSMISFLLIKPPSCHFYYMAFLKNNFHYRKALGPRKTQKTEQQKIQCSLDSCSLDICEGFDAFTEDSCYAVL